jgi:hypothetical protein
MVVTRRWYRIEVFTSTFSLEGTYAPVGRMLDALNREGNVSFVMSDVSFTPLAPGTSLRTISVPSMTLNKDQILFFAFEEGADLEDLMLRRRVERAILYVPHFVLRGEFHLGTEDRFHDVLDAWRGQFQPITSATLYPLDEIRGAVRKAHDLVIVNTGAIQLYHPERPS